MSNSTKYITRKASLYIVAESPDGPIKIGISCDPKSRLRTLQVGNSRPLSLVTSYRLEDAAEAKRIEGALHLELEDRRIGGEWFDLSPDYMKIYMPDFWRSEGYEP